MERIYLRKEEKALLYAMRGGMKAKPQDTPAEEWNAACYLLERKGMIRRNMAGNASPEVELTEKGSCYLFFNPKLKNPRRWREEGIVLAALLLLMAAATLLLLTIK